MIKRKNGDDDDYKNDGDDDDQCEIYMYMNV